MNDLEEMQRWLTAINRLVEVITDPNFDNIYPAGLTRKNIIDLVFDRGSLSSMSDAPKNELRTTFYHKFLNRA